MPPFLTSILKDVNEKYETMELLGSGAYGMVFKCKDRETGRLAAVKTIAKYKVDNLESLHREIEILKEVKHPHIIEFYDVYEDEDEIHLVTELCTGGELYDKVIEKAESAEGHFSEYDAGLMTRDILDAIRYCHDDCKIVHRDLKPENFLLKHPGDDAPIKIIDFGLSRRDDAPFGVMSSRVGTPYYVAPEVLENEYTNKCDIWSIGVIAYVLLCGFAPFAGDNDSDTMRLVQSAPLEFPSPEWDDISPNAIDFVTSLLQRDPLLRPTAAEALKHPWLAQHAPPPGLPPPRPFHSKTKSETSSLDLSISTTRRSAFQKFLAGLKVEKALGVLAKGAMTASEAKELGEVFRKVDKNNDGTIAIEELDAAIKADSNSFSTSLKENLKVMRSALAKRRKHPRQFPATLNIKPFLQYAERKSKSAML